MTAPHQAVRMRGISRRFGSVQALRGADFSCDVGEIHALLGENGAGKSTLMHILFGLVTADSGSVEVAMTLAENVWLGRRGLRYDQRAAGDLVRRVAQRTGLHLDPAARAGEAR